MQEPSPRTSRLAIASGLLALILVGGAGLLLGRTTAPGPATLVSAKPAPSPPVAVPSPPTERILSRVDLIALANAAADANASNTPLPPSINEAAGQRFELFLPFGCDGPAPKGSEASLQWRYDSEASTLRVRAQPTSWNLQDWWQAPPPELEALEGFWITRPWSSQEICPRSDVTSASRGLDPVTAPRQTLGVAQLVTEDTPRQLRRGGRAYEIVTRVPPEALRLDAGLRIRLRGRVVRFPQSDAVRCAQPGGLEQRPVCLIGVTFDEVAIDNPATLDVLAVWAPTVANPSHPD